MTWKDNQHHSWSGSCKSKTTIYLNQHHSWSGSCKSPPQYEVYHLIPVRMTKTRNTKNNKYWQVCGIKGSFIYFWWECNLVQRLWKTEWRYLKKLNIELPYDPVILLLGIYAKKMKTLIGKSICTTVFIAALFTVAKIWK